MGGVFDSEKDMVDILLNIKLSKLKDNGQTLRENVSKIEKKLQDLDITKNNNKYLCLSCIYGAFLGDSIGSCCEFNEPSSDNHKLIFTQKHVFEPGEITDDSEMALSAAFAYMDSLDNDNSRIKDYLFFYFGIWCYSNPKDIGQTTSDAFVNFYHCDIKDIKFDQAIAEKTKKTNWKSLANGALMRISTFIVYYYYMNLNKIKRIIIDYFSDKNPPTNTDLNDDICNLYLDIFIEIYKNVQITHPNYENGISCAVFALMVLVGMITKDAKKVYSIFKLISKSQKFVKCHQAYENSYDKITSYASNIQKGYSRIIKDIEQNVKIYVFQHMGYYQHAFKLSIYYLVKYPDMGENQNKNLYYEIMCDVCDRGGDTDTNCAIVGTMIGPLIGYKNFKPDLFSRFIKFVPKRRSQFNSAFAYVYVNYLEEKLLNKDNQKIENNTKKEEFVYTSFNKIKKFLEEKMEI